MSLQWLFLFGFAGGGESQSPAARPEAEFRVSVSVNLVLLTASVRERKGSFVAGLHEADFEVYEDGVRQTLRLFRNEDVPVAVGMVVDHSGSMRSKLAEVSAAARIFAQSSRTDDEIFVVNFNENVRLGLPIGIPFTNRPADLALAISGFGAEGKTALYDAAIETLRRLNQATLEKKVMIVISDGGDNASTGTLAELVKKARESSTTVYTIGISGEDDPDRNPGALRRLAQVTGGEAFFPEQLADITAVCRGIAKEIRNQYTLGFISSNTAQPGAIRSIKVVARAGTRRLTVRARSGYVAGAP